MPIDSTPTPHRFIETRRVGLHIVLLVFNRPEARNAVNAGMTAEVGEYLRIFEADPDLRVGIVAGNGPVFCAGADVKEDTAGVVSAGGFAGFTQVKRTKPWIACLQGPAIGGGAELALACELLVMAEHATLVWPGVQRGLVARSVGAIYAPRRLPHAVFHEMMLTGEPLSAQRALQYGLANSVVAAGGERQEALRLAGQIARVPTAFSRAFLDKALATAQLPIEEAWRINDEAVRRGEL